MASNPRPITGIDVSHWQGDIDWKRVALSGERFAFVKVSEGVGHTDSRWEDNVLGAHNAGLQVGVYHFARPSGRGRDLRMDARAEADFFAGSIVRHSHMLRLGYVLDLEKSGGLRPEEVVQWADVFCDRLQAYTYRRPIVYVGPNFWRWSMARSLRLADLPLWLVRHKGSPRDVPDEGHTPTRAIPGWRTMLWQWTNKGNVPGVEVHCDRNVWMGTGLEWARFLREQSKLDADAEERPCWLPNPAGPITVIGNWLLNAWR